MTILNWHREWLRFHAETFPDFGAWLERQSDDTLRSNMLAFLASIGAATFEDLKAATTKMLVGHERPSFATEHFQFIINHLTTRRRESEQYTPEAARYARRCGRCGDTGLADAVITVAGAATTHGGVPLKVGAGITVRCTCSKGNARKVQRFPAMNPQYAKWRTPPGRADAEAVLERMAAEKSPLYGAMKRFLDGAGPLPVAGKSFGGGRDDLQERALGCGTGRSACTECGAIRETEAAMGGETC